MNVVGHGFVLAVKQHLVLAIPNAWEVSLGRVMIVIAIALPSAANVDLAIFDLEVKQQWRNADKIRVTCDANGSRRNRNYGADRVCREMSRHAAILRDAIAAVEARLQQLLQQLLDKKSHREVA